MWCWNWLMTNWVLIIPHWKVSFQNRSHSCSSWSLVIDVSHVTFRTEILIWAGLTLVSPSDNGFLFTAITGGCLMYGCVWVSVRCFSRPIEFVWWIRTSINLRYTCLAHNEIIAEFAFEHGAREVPRQAIIAIVCASSGQIVVTCWNNNYSCYTLCMLTYAQEKEIHWRFIVFVRVRRKWLCNESSHTTMSFLLFIRSLPYPFVWDEASRIPVESIEIRFSFFLFVWLSPIIYNGTHQMILTRLAIWLPVISRNPIVSEI